MTRSTVARLNRIGQQRPKGVDPRQMSDEELWARIKEGIARRGGIEAIESEYLARGLNGLAALHRQFHEAGTSADFMKMPDIPYSREELEGEIHRLKKWCNG